MHTWFGLKKLRVKQWMVYAWESFTPRTHAVISVESLTRGVTHSYDPGIFAASLRIIMQHHNISLANNWPPSSVDLMVGWQMVKKAHMQHRRITHSKEGSWQWKMKSNSECAQLHVTGAAQSNSLRVSLGLPSYHRLKEQVWHCP